MRADRREDVSGDEEYVDAICAEEGGVGELEGWWGVGEPEVGGGGRG